MPKPRKRRAPKRGTKEQPKFDPDDVDPRVYVRETFDTEAKINKVKYGSEKLPEPPGQ
jgi:hypothetical protein